MANIDDIYNQITRNTQRRGRSFFPAANAINSTPQGQVIQSSGSGYSAGGGGISPGYGGYGPNAGSLPPDQNPAYQAAISKGRPARTGYTMIQTPSGGSMAVPIGQARKYTDLLYKGNPTADTGFQRPDPATAYAMGDTGAVPTGNTPYARSYNLGYQGGPVNPAPSAGFGYQVGQLASNIPSALGGLGRNIASWFGGGGASGNAYQPPETRTAPPETAYIPPPAGVGNLVNPPARGTPPAPSGIYNLVPPNPYVGRSPNERMFPTGGYGGASQPFPNPNPAPGTVRMGNERFPGNLPMVDKSPYPTPVSNPIYNPTLQVNQGRARRYSDLGYY